jgi:hypothetical protein
LYRLGVQGVKFWFFLVLFFCHVWLQHLSKIFDFWSSCCLLLHSSCHLGASLYFFHLKFYMIIRALFFQK